MSYYNLLDHQKRIVRELVKIYEETQASDFYFSSTSGGSAIWYEGPPDKRRHITASSSDLQALAAEDLIILKFSGRNGEANGGSIRQSAVEAVRDEFRKPLPPSAGGAVYQTFYAPVGAVNAGPSRIEITRLDVGASASDLAALIADLRDLAGQLPAPERAEAAENLNDLEGRAARGDSPPVAHQGVLGGDVEGDGRGRGVCGQARPGGGGLRDRPEQAIWRAVIEGAEAHRKGHDDGAEALASAGRRPWTDGRRPRPGARGDRRGPGGA